MNMGREYRLKQALQKRLSQSTRMLDIPMTESVIVPKFYIMQEIWMAGFLPRQICLETLRFRLARRKPLWVKR